MILFENICNFFDAGRTASCMSFGDTPGNPVTFPKKYFDDLKSLPEGKGGSVIIKEHPEDVLLVPVAFEAELFDIDTKESLEKAEELIAGC